MEVDPEVPAAGKRKGAHRQRQLTPLKVKRAGPGRHGDGNGLFLVVEKSGARRWVLRTVVHGRRRDMGLGSAALVPLADARELARRFRSLARSGADPILERDKEQRQPLTFADAARKVHREQVEPTATNGKHVAQWLASVERYAFPIIGEKSVGHVEQADVLRVLSPIWTDKPETARRVRQRIRTIMDWAIAEGFRDGKNPVEGVERGLAKQRERPAHFKALPWVDLPDLWARMASLEGAGVLALRFAILTCARSGEVRTATWADIDLEARQWVVPAERMKARVEHRVPLSDAALAILNDANRLTPEREGLLFPSKQHGRTLSDMTLAAVLKRMKVDATPHGFRSTFRDWAEETTTFPHEVKEAALAHVVKSKVERAYRRTDLFAKRVELMAAWGRYVTSAGGVIVRLAS